MEKTLHSVSEGTEKRQKEYEQEKILIPSGENKFLLCMLGVGVSYQTEISNNSGLAKVSVH